MTDPWPPMAYFPPPAGGPEEPLSTQTVVDCDDPHAQARFWAAALGYVVEDPHDMVHAVLRAGYATDADTVVVDGRTAWRTMTGIRHPGTLDAARGRGRRILFVAVPDRTPGRNSWHLDLNVGRERIDAEVARLTALGATVRATIDEPGGFHTTMADPEGNLFDVQ